MPVKLTLRMQNWITRLGVHIATSDLSGKTTVVVAEKCLVEGSKIKIPLNENQIRQIEANIRQNPQAALAPGQLGSIRAPYQIKGTANLATDRLELEINEIYCTKPGAEAGLRLDVLGVATMNEFDTSRWSDIEPPQ